MNSEVQSLQINDRVLTFRQPEGDGPFSVMLLNHGWTGNETSMWVFTSKLPRDVLMIAPRAPFKSPLGGYSWVEHKSGEWPWLGDFRHAIDAILGLLSLLPGHFNADFSRVDLVGFSQGGALSYALALLHPDRVDRVAGLASFMPERCEQLLDEEPLAGKSVFVGHGTQDQLVPIERARKSVQQLQQAGADVSYCETDVGHKLGADCFNALQVFYQA
jgi:phospholipase/carboxylesterase